MAVSLNNGVANAYGLPEREIPLDTYFEEVVYATSAAAGLKTITPAVPARKIVINVNPTSSTAPTNLGVYVVFNALNDTDATFRLSTTGRTYIPMGRSREFVFDSTSPCTRVDIIGTTTSNESAGFRVDFDIGVQF